MSKIEKVWIIKLVFCDEENNGFVTLGGAGFQTKAEWDLAWANIPPAEDGWDSKDALCADKLDLELNQVDERPVTASLTEKLLGKPMVTLIKEGRANTCFTYGHFLATHDQPAKQAIASQD